MKSGEEVMNVCDWKAQLFVYDDGTLWLIAHL